MYYQSPGECDCTVDWNLHKELSKKPSILTLYLRIVLI